MNTILTENNLALMVAEEWEELQRRLPPGWMATKTADNIYYRVIRHDGVVSYAQMDRNFTLDEHIKVYWRLWGEKYGC